MGTWCMWTQSCPITFPRCWSRKQREQWMLFEKILQMLLLLLLLHCNTEARGLLWLSSPMASSPPAPEADIHSALLLHWSHSWCYVSRQQRGCLPGFSLRGTWTTGPFQWVSALSDGGTAGTCPGHPWIIVEHGCEYCARHQGLCKVAREGHQEKVK